MRSGERKGGGGTLFAFGEVALVLERPEPPPPQTHRHRPLRRRPPRFAAPHRRELPASSTAHVSTPRARNQEARRCAYPAMGLPIEFNERWLPLWLPWKLPWWLPCPPTLNSEAWWGIGVLPSSRSCSRISFARSLAASIAESRRKRFILLLLVFSIIPSSRICPTAPFSRRVPVEYDAAPAYILQAVQGEGTFSLQLSLLLSSAHAPCCHVPALRPSDMLCRIEKPLMLLRPTCFFRRWNSGAFVRPKKGAGSVTAADSLDCTSLLLPCCFPAAVRRGYELAATEEHSEERVCA